MAISDFDHILIVDTFVWSWSSSGESLVFRVLASLLQSHPQAAPPPPDEWACYREGVIEFHRVASINGLADMSTVRSTTDPDGYIDFGTIDELLLISPGVYRIAGDFGTVQILAEDVTLVLAPSQA